MLTCMHMALMWALLKTKSRAKMFFILSLNEIFFHGVKKRKASELKNTRSE